MSVPRSPLTRAIQALGMTPKQFIEEKLGTKYSSFMYRARQGVLRLSEYHKIMQLTGCSFETLWPSPYAPTTQRIPLNLSNTSHQALQPATTKIVPDRLAPEPETKEEPRNVTPLVSEIYDNGLPPID